LWYVSFFAPPTPVAVTCLPLQAFLYDHDSRFWDGWHLDTCFHLVTASWTILVLTSVGIIASALYLPSEGDYELIMDEHVEPDDR
jgi:hypothetical protein